MNDYRPKSCCHNYCTVSKLTNFGSTRSECEAMPWFGIASFPLPTPLSGWFCWGLMPRGCKIGKAIHHSWRYSPFMKMFKVYPNRPSQDPSFAVLISGSFLGWRWSLSIKSGKGCANFDFYMIHYLFDRFLIYALHLGSNFRLLFKLNTRNCYCNFHSSLLYMEWSIYSITWIFSDCHAGIS